MSESPTAAWILSLIGGMLGLLLYLGLLASVLVVLSSTGATASSMVEEVNATLSLPLLGTAYTLVAGLCGWFIIANIIIIIGALKIKSGEPSSVRTWGIVVLILSIIGGGNILSLVGGILALTWKPPRRIEAEAPPPPPPS